MIAGKTQKDQLKVFVSYSHQDANLSRKFVNTLFSKLADLTQSNLANAQVELWTDRELAAGDVWSKEIDLQLQQSQALIVLLSPSWISSEACLRELETFLEVEPRIGVGGFILPIVLKDLRGQTHTLNQRQRDAYSTLLQRQYKAIYDAKPSKSRQRFLLEFLESFSYDLSAVLDKSREPLPENSDEVSLHPETSNVYEWSRSEAHSFSEVGLVSNAEYSIEKEVIDNEWALLCHVSVFERLYVEGELGRVDFSVQRAFVTVLEIDFIENSTQIGSYEPGKSHYFLEHSDFPMFSTLCVNGTLEKNVLAGSVLPNTGDGNYFSKLGSFAKERDFEKLQVVVHTNISVESMFFDERTSEEIPGQTLQKIKAIISAAAKRGEINRKTMKFERRV